MKVTAAVATTARRLRGFLSASAARNALLPTARAFSTDATATADKAADDNAKTPPKYENVRKLIVGLGNPGEKYAKTRHNIGSMAVTHFLDTYVQDVLGTKLAFQHEASNHGDVARFAISFQQDVDTDEDDATKGTAAYTYRVDDLVNCSSKRRKDKTLEEGVPHPDVNVALLLPTTYMNRSGVAVKTFMNAHHWRLKKNALALNRQDELLVVTDDVALPFGTCRFKSKGGPGGQNGIKDIIKCVSTERFARLKIGVGAPQWFSGGNTGAPSGTAMDKFVLGKFNPEEQDAMTDLLEYVNELLRLYLHRGVAQATTVANSMDLATYKKEFQGKKRKASNKRQRSSSR
uniref:Peptidyl-tRNA hydrolase n=1 Tax=Globisporangium ultimum (strain ATCC 200006 / CBS 805.95 / DAOM BR144) TaxID=431595 RepID=K3WMR8_GLOUD